MEWAEYHGPEKQEYLAKTFWEMRKFSDGEPSFTPDMLNTIKAKWLVVNGDNHACSNTACVGNASKYIQKPTLDCP